MNNRPPISEALPSPGWSNWFSQVFACLPWKRGFNYTADLNFGAVAAQGQTFLPVTVAGARVGDAVQVATADVTGIIFTGAVVADDTVNVYAKNFSAGIVDPTLQTFRLVVLQN